jgi:hypothetical protein
VSVASDPRLLAFPAQRGDLLAALGLAVPSVIAAKVTGKRSEGNI